jgi:hypothetical protein
MAIAGIKYEKNIRGINTHVRIDLKRYGNNELLEDFLDGVEAENLKGSETITLDEFKSHMDKRFKKNV